METDRLYSSRSEANLQVWTGKAGGRRPGHTDGRRATSEAGDDRTAKPHQRQAELQGQARRAQLVREMLPRIKLARKKQPRPNAIRA